ncbi:hypothetical protein BDZ94DRAFT_1252777 [Collybia nuda]|uniref:Chromo domain-containing protein n=1 Tax=Collybia nuda TaxID=64659 RepID=A0A9P5YC68_9AGAR|nr:hypothetical protein BDZ94DRAFT_1252777 [Collybia nuda]
MGGEGESNLDVSEPETQFIPQENDEEELWEVIEITAEKGRRYKVKWAGTDPKTHKPWPQSWVAKHDCTNDLVKTWKKVQALKKKEGAQRKSGKTLSAVSKKSRLSSVARGSTVSSSETSKNERSNDTTPIAGPSTLNTNLKRKHSPLESAKSDNLSSLGAVVEPPPRKKRKLEVDLVVESDVSDGEITPVMRPGRVGVSKAASDKGKQKANGWMDIDGVEEQDNISVGGGKKGNVLGGRKNLLVGGRSSVTSGQSKMPATKKVKTEASVSASRRSSITQQAISPPSTSGNDSPSQPEPLFLADRPEDSPDPPKQRPASTPHQSIISGTEERARSPEIGVPVSPVIDLSRLTPTGRAQLAEFDAFVANTTTDGVLLHSHEEIDINHMYDEYVDFNPRNERDSSNPRKAKNRLSKAPTSSPPTSPPPLPEEGTEPLVSDEEDLHPMTSSPPPLKLKQLQARSSWIPNVGSFRQGVVPETETESSTNNTQSQTKLPPPVPQIIEPPVPDPATTTPARASLIRRMRPRTPGSANGSKLSLIDEANTYDPLNHDYDDGDGTIAISHEDWPILTKNITNLNGKTLRPIPILSPSKFVPHLPPSSISNQPTEGVEVEDLISSIEQFSSSGDEGSKTGRHARRKQLRNKGKRKRTEPEQEPEPEAESQVQAQDISITEDEDTIEMSVMERGQKMAEAARKERLVREKHLAGKAINQKVSLVDLVKANNKRKQKRSKDKKSLYEHQPGNKDSSAPHTNETKPSTPEAQTRSITPDVHLFIPEIQVSEGPEPGADNPHELGDADAGAEDEEGVPPAIALREEEEESTQDIMADIAIARRGMDEVDINMGWNLSGSPEIQAVQGDQPESPAHIELALDENEPAEAPEDFEPQPHDSTDDVIMESVSIAIPPQSHPRLLSRSRSVSVHPESPRPVDDESLLILPTTTSTRQITPDINSGAVPQDELEHLGAAMALLNTKSQEIAKLDTLLVAEQTKNETLSREMEALKTALIAATNKPQPKGTELESELSEARSLLVQERSAWDRERSKMSASVEALTREKASVQSDLEFFREQYARASGFVSSVRRENEELKERARIAEERATAGVAMVKATFEKRVDNLEGNTKNWSRIAMFMMEKDQRTNDDIRRRAGEEPELRARFVELEGRYESMSEELIDLVERLDQKDQIGERLKAEVDILKNEITRLNVELNDAQTKYERSSKGEGSQNEHEMIYRCQWRPEGGNDPCEGLFVSVEELQAHLFTEGHLQS